MSTARSACPPQSSLLKMLNRIVVPLLCAAAIAVACGPRAHSSTTTETPAAATARKRAPDEPTLASSLDISVKGGVKLAFHATNRDTKRIELVFPSGQTHDFAILDASGREVWRWSKDRLFTQALQNRVLEPSETISYEERWTPGDLRGTFVAVATLRSSSHPVESRVEFTLP